MASDGQVTLGETVLKSGAGKVKRTGKGKVLVGFAGGAADGLRLQFEAVSQLGPDEKEVVRSVLEGLLLKNQAKRLAHLGQ